MMCDGAKKHQLPILPGYIFTDPVKSKFHKSQCFNYSQGIPSSKTYISAPGNSPRDIDSVQFLEYGVGNPRLDPVLIYGRKKAKAVVPFKPHYVKYDRTCLRFQGYFQQEAYNCPNETHRIRVVDFYYFLDDDTVTVIEPLIHNSGLTQGRLVRRSRIPQGPPPDCLYLHWKDLNIGHHIRVCGFILRLVDCDSFTREFLQSQGIDVSPPEDIPTDVFTKKKLAEQNGCSRPSTAPADHKLRRFLRYDGIVLKFRAAWDTRSSGGDLSSYCVLYFLADDTIQVAEIHEKNSGKDPFPILLRRTKLPKSWEKVPLTYPSITEEASLELTEFYQPKDLIVGQTLVVFGRQLLLHKCDDFTRKLYEKSFNITQPPDFEVKNPPSPTRPRALPPYTGIGELEDSLQSCISFSMKSPRKDTVKKIVNANKLLRYKAKMLSTHPEDADREFIFSYSLADGTVQIVEPPLRNSGHVGGRFLSSVKIKRPGFVPEYPEYYTPQDFYIGGIVEVNDFRFEITGADLHVYNYMKENSEKFRPDVIESVKRFVETEGLKPNTNAKSREVVKSVQFKE